MTGRTTWEKGIFLDGRYVSYTVRRSARAKRMSLRVLPETGLEVVLPRGVALREAASLIQRERDWVFQALAWIRRFEPVDVRDGTSLPYLGQTLILRRIPGTRTRVTRDDQFLTITSASETTFEDAVKSWYRSEARRVIGERVEVHARVLGVAPGRIAIKDTRSRWGSCSSKGNLNFSWRLLLAPFPVLDYVVAHEVAHLRQLDHSPRFWALVESLCPSYRDHRRWLRMNSADLAAWPSLRTSDTPGSWV